MGASSGTAQGVGKQLGSSKLAFKRRAVRIQYGHALANTQPLLMPPRRGKRHQHWGTTHIDKQKVGCARTQDVRRTRQSLPTGFTSRDPAPASHLALIMLRV